MPHRLRPAALAAFALLMVATACGDPLANTRDVPTTLPWRGATPETTRYVVKDSTGGQVATAALTIEERSSTTTFSIHYENGESTDDVLVIVDGVTLRPQKSTRTIRAKDLSRDLSADYGADKVHIVISGDQQEDEEIDFPPHAYDNEQALFLWRTLAFAVGYETEYVVINSARRSGRVVTARVVAIETVTIAGGSFECWRVEATTTSDKEIAWYEKAGNHRLVRYETDRSAGVTTFVWELLP